MFVCNECGAEFEDEGDLGIHLTHEEEYGEELDDGKCKCTLCGAEFEDWGDLDMHLMRGEKKGRLTGDDLKRYNEAINSDDFKELREEMDIHDN